MDVSLAVVSGALLISALGNAFLFFWLIHFKRQSRVQLTQDATMLMNDLTSRGRAVVLVTYVSPEDVLLRSPRDVR